MQRLQTGPLLGCASILVDFIGLGMVAPILPAIVSKQAVGNILTAQYLAVVFGQIAAGAFADKFGRRRAIMVVMAFDAILFSATGFTQDVLALIILRLLAGCSAPVAIGISYVAAVSQNLPPAKAQFNFALVGISFNVGTVIGAATGGLLGPEQWLPANLVAGAVPALVTLWALFSEDIVDGDDGDTADKAKTTSTATTPKTVEIEAPAPAAAQPTANPATPPPHGFGMRSLFRAPEFLGVLLAYVAQGLFQGSFFSLMPVVLAMSYATTNATAIPVAANTSQSSSQDDVVGSNDTAPIIASVIMAAGVLQIIANLFLVRPSLKRLGSHGHIAWTNLVGALLVAPTAYAVGLGASFDFFLHLILTLYPAAYVCSATCLTVLNQAASINARRYKAPVGTINGIARSIFAAAFGLAPAGSIALYDLSPWLPFAIMGSVAFVTSTLFIWLKLRAPGDDPVPPEKPLARTPRTETAAVVAASSTDVALEAHE